MLVYVPLLATMKGRDNYSKQILWQNRHGREHRMLFKIRPETCEHTLEDTEAPLKPLWKITTHSSSNKTLLYLYGVVPQ